MLLTGIPALEKAVALATNLGEDDRPESLKQLRDAMHPTCPYYLFLYKLMRELKPSSILEIGTYVGTSAAHLLVGTDNQATQATVVTIDINPDAARCVRELNLPIETITADSFNAYQQFKPESFDVLYCDGWHDFNQTFAEYTYYRSLIKEGGLMIFDDVNLDMAGDEMNVFWACVTEPKVRLDHLHTTTGFGVVVKDSHRPPMATQAAAQQLISARR